MKKIRILTVCFAVVFAASACSQGTQEQTGGDGGSTQQETTTTTLVAPPLDSPDDLNNYAIYEAQNVLGLNEEDSTCLTNKLLERSGLSNEVIFEKIQNGEWSPNSLNTNPEDSIAVLQECNIDPSTVVARTIR